jgi:tetratricopeptide (TPR) repeat protein
MAQLSTLFIIAGLLGHLYGRSLIARNELRAYLIMSLSMGVFTLLAMLSKENGILLPLLIGVVELTVFSAEKHKDAGLNRYWTSVFVIAPSLVIFLYLIHIASSRDFFDINPPRDFSLYERFLTQPRVLFDYLQNWFIPKLYTAGVFQDHFQKSTGLFSPITTVLCALLHVSIIALSIVSRRRWPLSAFAILFFYASHVLESSVINLELYFEHRNYLAVAFLFVPLIALLQAKASRRIFVSVAFFGLLILGSFTRYSATVWADYSSMVETAAQKAPMSARAQGQYAVDLYNAQRYDEALQVVDRAIENIPKKAFLLLGKMNILCKLGLLDDGEFVQAAKIISASPYDPRSISVYTTLTSSVVKGECPGVSLDVLQSMYVDMQQVPLNAEATGLRFSQIQYFIGFVDAFANRPLHAIESFELSLSARPGASHAMMMAALMATNEYHDEALYLSDLALSQLDAAAQGPLTAERVRESDIREFQVTVRMDRDAALANDQTDE